MDAIPGIDLGTLTAQDALDLAILIEDEARERYETFTKQVGGRYAGDAADMFKGMAFNEDRHARELRERRQRLFGDVPARVSRDQIFEVEAPDMGAPRVYMSARQAMEIALASEQKARAFFVEALTVISDREVRSLFTELRDEEEAHEQFVRARLARLPPGPDVEEDEADEPGTDPGN
jgi:erythrin-vacuolar iron transport family protein